MDILLIGYSSFARRRVVPAITTTNTFEAIHVASRSASDDELAGVPKLGRVFRDYQQAIDDTPPGLVYVSLTNDAHATWAERSLERGHHVIVDKPAFTDLATAERLVALARDRSLVLAEATTYAYHPVIAHIRRVFEEHGVAPTHLTATLTPPLPLDSYRYRRVLGGGALLDLGPYTASIGRLIWGVAPQRVSACINSYSGDGEVDTSYSVLAEYGTGRVLVGHFGFTTEYRNWLHLLGPGLGVEAPRVFSTPPGMVTDLLVRHRDEITTEPTPAGDAVRLFLAAVLAAIEGGDIALLAETLLEDARGLDQLRRAAAQEP